MDGECRPAAPLCGEGSMPRSILESWNMGSAGTLRDLAFHIPPLAVDLCEWLSGPDARASQLDVGSENMALGANCELAQPWSSPPAA